MNDPTGLVFRYLCLTTKYDKPMNYSDDAMVAAAKGLKSLYELAHGIKISRVSPENDQKFWTIFLNTFNRDLNTPAALGIFRTALKEKTISYAMILKVDEILGLKIDETINRNCQLCEIKNPG